MEIFSNKALLSQGWASHVRLTLSAAGDIVSIEKNTPAPHGVDALPLILPGMVNAHSHAFQRAFAGLTESHDTGGGDFWSWRRALYGALQRLTIDDMKNIARHLYIELLKGGYTSVAEFHYLHHLAGKENIPGLASARALLETAEESGMGLTLLPTLYRHSNFGDQNPDPLQNPFILNLDEFLELISVLNEKIQQSGDQALGVAFHSLRAVAPDDIRSVLSQLKTDHPAIPKHIHIAEQEKEVQDCLTHTEKRPVEFFMSEIDVDDSWTLVHATHSLPAECDMIAKSRAMVALCPATEANLGDGVFPFEAFSRSGGRTAIGSDAHVCVEAAEELRLLDYTARLMNQTRSGALRGSHGHVGTALWGAAARHGAAACGRKIGALEVGARADLITLDTDNPQLTGRSAEQILDTYIFGGCGNLVRDVMVGGHWVVRGGRHHREHQAQAAYQATLKRLIAP